MVLQTSMGQNKLDVRFGDRNTLPYYVGILDSALLSDDDIVAAITAGRVMSLTTGTKLVPGILATAAAGGGNYPYYAWSGLDKNNSPDVERTRGMHGYLDKPTGGVGGPQSPGFFGIPTSSDLVGPFGTIQMDNSLELSSTAFDTSAGATYNPGDPLTAVAADSAEKANRGLLRPVELATDVIVGRVAPAARFTGPEGFDHLAFRPDFVAGTTVPDTILDND